MNWHELSKLADKPKPSFHITQEWNEHHRQGYIHAFLGQREIANLSYYRDYHDPNTFTLHVIATDKEYRGRGTARRLMQEMVNAIRQRHPKAKHIIADYMAQKSLHLANEVFGQPQHLDAESDDMYPDERSLTTEQAFSQLPPDAQEGDWGELHGPIVHGRHPLPRRIPKPKLQPFKPFHQQLDLPFSNPINPA